MPNWRSLSDGSDNVLNGDHLVLEPPCTPRFDGKSWAITGPTWKGFEHIRYVFIFGDSISATSVSFNMPGPDPTDEEPIGVPYPGVTSCEPGLPNWVGHLVTEYSLSPLLVYNYAVSGSTVTDVRMQIESYFYLKAGSKPRSVPWTAENSLFVTWVGMNDLAYTTQIQPSILELFLGEERLYEAGARNFLFIDLPPLDRAPACTQLTMFDVEDGDREATIRGAADRFANWNITLTKRVRDFSASHSTSNGNSQEKSEEPDAATVLFYSAHKTLTSILDDPVGHNFPPTDVSKMEAAIWADHLHPTSRVHDFLAHDLGGFLRSVKPL